ncbi:TRAP transporter large permease subunit [Pseudooceanicola aestuarii]|uniref:TRAP transporter large permease subunit n=1 Tax=Pseudooceanicola aestuarii TaxID=2697319 RepID=UPI0023BA6C80|nr:TRAP transporter large permease subunit [Pseudooceanicola aestuarii]
MLIFGVFGGLLVGIFTPTEAGAAGSALSILIAAVELRGVAADSACGCPPVPCASGAAGARGWRALIAPVRSVD